MIINCVVKEADEFNVTRGETWIIHVTEPMENNRANRQIIKELSREYSSVRILRGASSRKKTLELVP
ncbi:MAG: DUF167 domain-containing protein [Candidatus Aenigmarchaeota archaeon]|nr:DUF167 domain-containing protein [Candidatus Aenigmarchaeota archaeon]